MNMQVNFTEIIEAAAMANILYSEKEIEAMCCGAKPMVKKVADIVIKLANGEYVEPPKEERLRAEGAGRPSSNQSENRRIAQRESRPFEYYVPIILEIIKDKDVPSTFICDQMNEPLTKINHILKKMQKIGMLESQLVRRSIRHWFKAGYSADHLEAFKVAKEIRATARNNRLQHYEALPCQVCSTTKRVTLTDKCVECSRVYGLNKYKRRMEVKRGLGT